MPLADILVKVGREEKGQGRGILREEEGSTKTTFRGTENCDGRREDQVTACRVWILARWSSTSSSVLYRKGLSYSRSTGLYPETSPGLATKATLKMIHQ